MPATRITCKQVTNLTPQEYAQCRRLNLGDNGHLRECLEFFYVYAPSLRALPGDQPPARVLLLRENASRKLLAWCMLDEEEHAQLYVHSKHRRKGLGTRLMRQLLRVCPRATIFPHDEVSTAFFAHLNADSDIALNVERGYALDGRCYIGAN